MNSIGKNYVKKYFEDNIKVHLSFQFRKIWTRIGQELVELLIFEDYFPSKFW